MHFLNLAPARSLTEVPQAPTRSRAACCASSATPCRSIGADGEGRGGAAGRWSVVGGRWSVVGGRRAGAAGGGADEIAGLAATYRSCGGPSQSVVSTSSNV